MNETRRRIFHPSLCMIIIVFNFLVFSVIQIQKVNQDVIGKIKRSVKGLYDDETFFQNSITKKSQQLNYTSLLLGQKPPNTSGAFLHLGKTAGSTLTKVLRNGCHTFVRKPCLTDEQLPPSKESYISKLTTYYHVPDFTYQNLYQNHKSNPYDFFVITARDPLKRAISSFLYSHPVIIAEEKLERWQMKNPVHYLMNIKFAKNPYDKGSVIEYLIQSGKVHENITNMYSCFNTLEEYAQLLSDFTKNVTNTADSASALMSGNQTWADYYRKGECHNVAKSTLLHMNAETRDPMVHNYWDLQEMLYQVHDGLRNKTKLVIRQEYLWDDWTSANQYLGEHGTIHRTNLTHRKFDGMNIPNKMKLDRTLSDSGRKNLCFALEKEYKLYLRLLVVADNLSERDVEDSYVIAKESCPWLDLKVPSVDDVETVVMSKSRGQWEL